MQYSPNTGWNAVAYSHLPHLGTFFTSTDRWKAFGTTPQCWLSKRSDAN